MTELFRRQCSVIVDTLRVDGLRIGFAVEKKDTREANKATITITNLSAETRARFEAKGLRVVLEAGYVGGVGAVFIGTSYRTTHKRSGADMVTTIEAADGGKEIAGQKGSWSFAAGARCDIVVRTVAAGLGLPLSTGSVIAPTLPSFRNGWAFVGGAADALDAVTKACGLAWSVQDGQLQILKSTDPRDGQAAVVLSSETGMIGSPERVDVKDDKTGVASSRVSVRCLINPRIRPSRMVQVRSVDVPALSGNYVVKTQKITGDTFADDWTMVLELARV